MTLVSVAVSAVAATFVLAVHRYVRNALEDRAIDERSRLLLALLMNPYGLDARDAAEASDVPLRRVYGRLWRLEFEGHVVSVEDARPEVLARRGGRPATIYRLKAYKVKERDDE